MRLFILAMFVALSMAAPWLILMALVVAYLHHHYINPEPLNKVRKWFTAPMKTPKKEVKVEKNSDYGFTTYTDMKEKAIRGLLKPGFEKDPEWIKKTAALHEIMRQNKLKNEAELAKEGEEQLRSA